MQTFKEKKGTLPSLCVCLFGLPTFLTARPLPGCLSSLCINCPAPKGLQIIIQIPLIPQQCKKDTGLHHECRQDDRQEGMLQRAV